MRKHQTRNLDCELFGLREARHTLVNSARCSFIQPRHDHSTAQGLCNIVSVKRKNTPLSDILWPMTRVSDGMLRPKLLGISISGARSAFNFARLVTMTNVNPLTEVSWIHEMVPWSFVERSLHRDFLVEPLSRRAMLRAVTRYAVRAVPYKEFPVLAIISAVMGHENAEDTRSSMTKQRARFPTAFSFSAFLHRT